MAQFEMNKNGTMLSISPLMVGIEHDISECLSIIECAGQLNLSEDDLFKTTVYLSNLLSTRTKLQALDNSSDGMVDIFRKYYAAVAVKEVVSEDD